jgi:hypothetical protein
MDGSCSDDSEIEEERAWAGGGPGPTGGGLEQEDPGQIRADDVYPECWRSTHLSDDGGDTPCASGHCMCDLHMHMYHYDRAEVLLTLFRCEIQQCFIDIQNRCVRATDDLSRLVIETTGQRPATLKDLRTQELALDRQTWLLASPSAVSRSKSRRSFAASKFEKKALN